MKIIIDTEKQLTLGDQVILDQVLATLELEQDEVTSGNYGRGTATKDPWATSIEANRTQQENSAAAWPPPDRPKRKNRECQVCHCCSSGDNNTTTNDDAIDDKTGDEHSSENENIPQQLLLW